MPTTNTPKYCLQATLGKLIRNVNFARFVNGGFQAKKCQILTDQNKPQYIAKKHRREKKCKYFLVVCNMKMFFWC